MCGIFGYIGVLGDKISLEIAKNLLQLLVHRGQDASGLAWVDEYGMHRDSKAKGAPFQIKTNGEFTDCFIGSTRYPTYGIRFGDLKVDKFAQPFSYQSSLGSLSLCHNGQISNIGQLTYETFLSDAEFITFKVGKLLDETNDLVTTLIKLSSELDGAYSIVGILGKRLFAFRDPRGIRPIVTGSNGSIHVVASESLVLQQAGITNIRNLKPGELMICDSDGSPPEFIQIVSPKKSTPCMFEWVYFASAASDIDKRNVYTTRLSLGKELAILIKAKNIDFDYITPIPDTSKTACN
ncbi:MAG: hypothetical protein ACXAD7_21270, partial [Candidatus Kariarchaeaceae archaeon]